MSRGRVVLSDETRSLPLASLVSPATLLPTVSGIEDHEDVIRAARELAFEEGRRAGLAEAADDERRREEARLDDIANALRSAATAVADNRQAITAAVLRESVDLVFGLLQELVGTELSLNEELTTRSLLRALELAPPEDDLVVQVHPDSGIDLEALARRVPIDRISLRADPTVGIGGVVIEAGACRIDAQVGPALERVRAVLDELASAVRNQR